MRYSLHIIILFLLLISCDRDYNMSRSRAENISNDHHIEQTDSAVLMLIAPYKARIEDQLLEIIAYSTEPMIKNKPESNLTNLIADVLWEEGMDYCIKNKTGFSPDIAYTNYKSIRSVLPQGEITVRNVFELMPFDNTLVFVKISKEKFQELAWEIANNGGDCISKNMKLGIKDNQVSTLTVNNQNIDSQEAYWIATNNYVAEGGDNMHMFLNPIKRVNTSVKIRDILINFFKSKHKLGESLSGEKDGRIFYEQ